MNRTRIVLALGAFAALAAPAQAADMALTRLDCGTPQAPVPVNQRFSDTYAYGDLKPAAPQGGDRLRDRRRDQGPARPP
jgi:N-acyl homoserine lactone hydrolase